MKRIIFFILVFLILIMFLPGIVQAVWVDPSNFETEVSIIWYDYGDSLNIRPESITLKFLDTKDSTNKPERILNATDCDITDLGDGIRTKWTGKVRLPSMDSRREDPVYVFNINQNDMFDTNYKCILSTGIVTDRDPAITNEPFVLELWPASSLNLTYNFKLIYDDDNDRDGVRSLLDNMKYKITSNIGITEENVSFLQADNYTNTRVLQTYAYDNNGAVDLSKPAVYSIEPSDTIPSITKHDNTKASYTYRLERQGVNITLYASYQPDMYASIPVSINFSDNVHKKPSSLDVKLKSQKADYETITLDSNNNYSSNFTSAYYWETGHEKAEYTVDIANTSDWEFDTTGDADNGFIIKATYIGATSTPETKPDSPTEEQNYTPIENEEKNDPPKTEVTDITSNNEKDETPKTGVNTIYVATASLLAVISLGAIVVSKK